MLFQYLSKDLGLKCDVLAVNYKFYKIVAAIVNLFTLYDKLIFFAND